MNRRLNSSGRRSAEAAIGSGGRLAALALLALGSGCAGDVAADVVSVGRQRAALSAIESAPALCSTASITTNEDNPTCAGPWEYEHWGRCTLRDPGCGELECVLWNQCRNEAFGWEVPPSTREVCQNVQVCDPEPQCEIDASGHRHCQPTCWTEKKCHTEPVPGLPALKRDPLCLCETFDYPQCSLAHPSCDADPSIVESAPGLSRAQLHDIPQISEKFSPICSTCDTLPMGTPAEAAAKYACLSARLQTLDAQPGSAPARFGEVAERLRLSSELDGEHLSVAQRALALTMYSRFPDAELACSRSVQPAEGSLGNENCPVEFRGQLDRCQHLSLAHVSAELAALEAAQCTALVTEVAELLSDPAGSACVQPAVREAVIDASQHVLMKSFQVVAALDPSALPASDRASLQRRMFDLDGWVKAIDDVYRIVGSSAGEDAEAARRAGYDRESAALAELYHQLQRGYDVFGGLTNVADIEVALQGVTERGLVMDRQVLLTAFTPVAGFSALQEQERTVLDSIPVQRPPLSGEALLLLVSDSLGGLVRRMDDLNAFHAFACRFRACGTHTPLSDLWSLLAALEDPAELRRRLDAIPKADGVDPLDGWWQVFDLIQKQHGPFSAAISAVTGGGTLAATPAESLRAQVRPLAERIRRATALYESYASRGQLDTAEGRVLFAGQESQQRGQLRDLLLQRVDRLAQEAGEYRSNLATLVAGLRAEVEQGAGIERLQREKERLALELDNHIADIAGLTDSAAADEQRFGEIGARFTEVARLLDSGQLLKLGDPPTVDLEFSGADAAFTGLSTNVPALASAGPLAASAGQLVTLSTAGEWSPTCALSNVRILRDLTDDAVPVDAQGALIGPEGFRLVETSSGFSARSQTVENSEDTHRQLGVRGELCVGAGQQIGLSARVCAYEDLGWSQRHAETSQASNGFDSRSSASFASGLRLPYPLVPFPAFPVGSLLVVETPHNASAPETIVDVHVVQSPQSSFLIRQDADLYFVINDSSCAGADALHRLQVRVGRLTTVGAIAPQVVAQMATTLGTLRGQTRTIQEQGEVLPSQLASLRSEAVQQLEARLGAAHVAVAFTELPQPLQDLFSAFLDTELVRIERAVRIYQHERAIEFLKLQLIDLQEETRNLQQVGRVDRLIPSWTLRNLDAEGVRERAGQTLEAFRKHLYPVLELWYPAALQKLHADSGQSGVIGKLDRLRDAGVEESVLDLTEVATDAMRDILSEYTLAEPGDPATGTVALALSHPNPCAAHGDFGEPAPLSDLPKAEGRAVLSAEGPTRSEAIWQAVYSGGKGRFSIQPEDIYRRTGGSAGELSCNVATPVIRQLAVVVVSKDTSAESEDRMRQLNQGRWLQGSTATFQPFLGEQGPVTYALGDYRRQSFQIPLIYVPYDTALTSFNQAMQERLAPLGGNDALFVGPSGLSPFAEIEVDFSLFETLKQSSVGTGLEDAVEIALMGVVEGRPTGPLEWIRTCKPDYVPSPPASSNEGGELPEFCPGD